MNTHITQLSTENLVEITELENLCFSDPWSEEMFQNIFMNENFFVYACKQNTLLISYIFYSYCFGEMEVINIATHPEYRRKGFAELLLRSIFEKLNPQDEIFLEVRSKNQPAMSLYTKLGFEQVGLRKKYYDDDDALVLKRIHS